jgi:UDP-N-acetylmuramyl pentapeptide synthase
MDDRSEGRIRTMDYQIIRDIITRMHATGDKHDQRMAEIAAERLDQLEAIAEAAREIAELRNDDTYKMYNVPARMVDALATALQAADSKLGDVETDAQ